MDLLLSPQLLLAALTLASVYALVSLGLNLIYGTMRLLNVAHGEVMMIGAYFVFWAFSRWHISPLVAMFGATVLTAALGWLCHVTIFKRMSRTPRLAARLEANSLLVFFGVSVILQNLGALAFSPDARSYSYLEDLVAIGDVSIALNRLVILAVCALVAPGIVLFFRFSMQGLAIRGLIQQRDAASLVGINADRVNAIVFCMGFGLAGLAGALVSMAESISPFSGFPFTIAAFVVVVLGGLGSIGGGTLGALLLALVEVYGSALTSTAYRSILVYGVFIAVLLIRPQGLLGRKVG
jgi:branched-chain amino acid transport system permease protein